MFSGNCMASTSNNKTISLFPITQSLTNYNNCINVFSGQSVVAPRPIICRGKNYNNCINGKIFSIQLVLASTLY